MNYGKNDGLCEYYELTSEIGYILYPKPRRPRPNIESKETADMPSTDEQSLQDKDK